MSIFDEINKRYKLPIISSGNDDKFKDVARIPTGVFELDVITFGGIPAENITLVWGDPSTSKTAQGLKTLGQAQKLCRYCFTRMDWSNPEKPVCPACKKKEPMVGCLVDAENCYKKAWAQKMGVDTSKLIVVTPLYGEMAVDIVSDLMLSREVDFIILDSIVAVVPKMELEKSTEDAVVGRHAMLMNRAFRKWPLIALDLKTREPDMPVATLYVINQVRHKIGVMYGCFHEDTHVMFADGSYHSIKSVVENKLVGPVTSYDNVSATLVERDIVGWHDNGALDDGEGWLTFHVDDGDNVIIFTCTPNHVIVRGDGTDAAASDVRVGDSLSVCSHHVKDKRCVVESHVISISSLNSDSNKYDLTIDKDSYYVVGDAAAGVIVHNSPDVMPGGQGQKFAMAMQIRFRGGAYVFHKETKQPIGRVIKAKVTKSKVSPPMQQAEYNFYIDDCDNAIAGSSDEEKAVLKRAISLGVVSTTKEKSKSTYSFNTHTWTAKKRILSDLFDDAELLHDMREAVLNIVINKRLI